MIINASIKIRLTYKGQSLWIDNSCWKACELQNFSGNTSIVSSQFTLLTDYHKKVTKNAFDEDFE